MGGDWGTRLFLRRGIGRLDLLPTVLGQSLGTTRAVGRVRTGLSVKDWWIVVSAPESLYKDPPRTLSTEHVLVDVPAEFTADTQPRNVTCSVEARIHGAHTD